MLGDDEHGNTSKMQFVCKPCSSNITGKIIHKYNLVTLCSA